MQNEIYFDNVQGEIPRTIRRRKKQLYESIRERMEFYFSDANLQKDRFLSKLLQQSPEVDLSIFLSFNRIQQLTHSIHDLRKALKKSQFLELTEDKSKVFRKTPVKEKTNVDACTIYVEQLAWDVDHDWLKLIFSRYGKVDYVSIPKYKHTGKIKGFAFVEFETPEAARTALEEFEREGCCLTNSMNPEKLCSIATFEDDRHEAKNVGNQQMNDGNKNNKLNQSKAPEETEMKVGAKRKLEKSEDTEGRSPKEKKLKKTGLKEDERGDIIKVGSSGVSGGEDDVSMSDKNEAQDENKECATVEMPVKKKKNRKKKKSLKTKPVKDVKMYGLQILSKGDWKRLRNKYLNIQKEKMKKLKQHLYKNQVNHPFRQHQQQQQQQQQLPLQAMEPPSKPRFAFTKGVVVKVTFEEPLKDGNQVNQFKCDAKSVSKVEYVDVEVGSKEGYVRFGDASAALEVVRSKVWEKMSVLEGEEEEEYWEKMKRDRNEKFESRKKFKKKRGRNKILDKTEKLMSKRIRLSVDE